MSARGLPAGEWLRCFWQPVYVGDKLAAGWAKRVATGED